MFFLRLIMAGIVTVIALMAVWNRLTGASRISLSVLIAFVGLLTVVLNIDQAQALFWILLGLALGGTLYADETQGTELTRQLVLITLMMVGGLYLVVLQGAGAFVVLLEGLSVEFIGAALTTLVVTLYTLWRGRSESQTEKVILRRLDALTEEVRQLRQQG